MKSILILMMVFALAAIAPVQAENKWYSANQTIGTVGAIGTDVYRTKKGAEIERRRIEADRGWQTVQINRDDRWAEIEHDRIQMERERAQLDAAVRMGEASTQTGRGITARANSTSVSAGSTGSLGRPMTEDERIHCQKYPTRGFCSGN